MKNKNAENDFEPINLPEGQASADGEVVTISADELNEIKFQILQMEAVLTRLLSQPLVYATVVKAKNEFDLKVFEQGDRMLVIDRELIKQKKFYGKIVSNGVSEDGWVFLEYPNGERDRLNIGVNGQLPQVKLLGKDDGMNVIISIDGKLFEVHGLWGVKFNPTDSVKVDMETKQIHSKADISAAGDVATVKTVVDNDHVEVEMGGTPRVVIHALQTANGDPLALEPGDRVMIDNSNTITLRVLEPDDKDCYNLVEESNVTWNDVAGLEDAKEQLIEALELPYRHPEIYKHYNKKPPKGVLLFGPPGCGKTLIVKASVNAISKIHGKENFQSGFAYVKGPELLSKWVGVAESNFRSLFARGRQHFKKHGYPMTMFIDEAEAILPMRGSGKSSDVENTIVPQFLSEMDGLEECPVIVILATNQQKRLDPAVTREGRVDRHIRIGRPTVKTAPDYLRIHMKNIPIAKPYDSEELAALAVTDLYNSKRLLYTVHSKGNKIPFTFGDVITGSMLAGLVDQATSRAMKRDLTTKKRTGVTPEDFKVAVSGMFKQHAELNPAFDLEDFCDTNGINRNEAKFERVPLVGD